MKILERIKWILFKKKMQQKIMDKLICEDPWTIEELDQMENK